MVDLISNPENMPQVAVANHRLKTIQQQERYLCSQDTTPDERKHYGLCVAAYTNFTNPLRRFISMVVQRLLIGKVNTCLLLYSIHKGYLLESLELVSFLYIVCKDFFIGKFTVFVFLFIVL